MSDPEAASRRGLLAVDLFSLLSIGIGLGYYAGWEIGLTTVGFLLWIDMFVSGNVDRLKGPRT